MWGSREAKATDSTGLLVGAVGIELKATMKVAGGMMRALNFEEGDLVTTLSQIFVKLDY